MTFSIKKIPAGLPTHPLLSTLLFILFLSPFQQASAGAELSAGVWWVYQNTLESDFTGANSAFDERLETETGGNFADPALVIYGADDGSHGPWHFNSEMRIGTGSFTNTTNNNSGDNFTMHKAWIGYDLSPDATVRIGKSQVPFGWKTANFWPGDMLQAGYGDQMDVGIKLSTDYSPVHFDLAWYHQDDWGETSTDTVDDNNHWGSSTTYRKLKTGVANIDFAVSEHHTLGVSYQNGRMQDLTAGTAANRTDSGRHWAGDIHYLFSMDQWKLKYRYMEAKRDFGDMRSLLLTCATCPLDTKVKTRRHAAHVSYQQGKWNFYLEGSRASSDTDNNTTTPVEAYAPGVSYQYGPGWLYLEYLWQNGDIGQFGDVYEADFRTIYASFDFYF